VNFLILLFILTQMKQLSEILNSRYLTPKVLRPISYQKPLKFAMFVAFAEKNKTIYLFIFESNYKILHLTYLRSCSKKFMKFDSIGLKI